MKKKHDFGELEGKILEVFISSETSYSVKDIQQKLKEDRAYTTIMTILSRLHGKGILKRVKEGRGFLYSLKQSKKETKRSLLSKMKQKLFCLPPSEIFSHFLDTKEEISEKELKKIEALIKDYKKRKR